MILSVKKIKGYLKYFLTKVEKHFNKQVLKGGYLYEKSV